MTWIKNYGQGRVFYNALGHEHELFWNPIVLQHYLDGIQFVLGRPQGRHDAQCEAHEEMKEPDCHRQEPRNE